MGYALMMGSCLLCKQVFGFNPHKVPSIRDKNGERQPICKSCMIKANELRKSHGLEPWAEPQPGAYEPINEEEL